MNVNMVGIRMVYDCLIDKNGVCVQLKQRINNDFWFPQVLQNAGKKNEVNLPQLVAKLKRFKKTELIK